MNTADRLFTLFISVLGLLAAYILFFVLPVAFKADADCLKAGYPKASTTIFLDSYCLNMQGAVTTVVVPKK